MRLDRLYKILFGVTYWDDLVDQGHGHVAQLLRRLQQRRNRFAHGQPEAIDDMLVTELIVSQG